MTMNRLTVLAIAATAVLGACRGTPFQEPPIHLNPNMDYQPKFQPQEANAFFADNKANRPAVEGTVARGGLIDKAFDLGLDNAGNPIAKMPVEMTKALILRGQNRYNIYCQPCHGGVGDGKGVVITYGYLPPPSFHEQRLVTAPDGHIYGVILNGIRTMPAYRHQVPVKDRWAIVAYIRALQKSQNATRSEVDGLGLTVTTPSGK